MKRRKTYAGIPLVLEPKADSLATVSRCVLIVLGFNGVNDFAKRAGMGPETAGHLLRTAPGELKRNWKKRHRTIIQAYEALHSAYLDRRERMTPATRAFVIDFIQAWQRWVLSDMLWLESPGKQKQNNNKYSVAQVVKNRERVKASVIAVFDGAEWE